MQKKAPKKYQQPEIQPAEEQTEIKSFKQRPEKQAQTQPKTKMPKKKFALPFKIKFNWLGKLFLYPKTVAFFCGWLTVAAFPPHYLFPVLFLTFSLLLVLINKANFPFQAFKIGYSFGFALFAFGFAWVGNALLIDAWHFGWLYPITLAASGAFFGLFIAIPAYLAFYFKNLLPRYLAFCSLFVIFEWIRSFFLTGFPWNLQGYVLAFSDRLIQLASIGGTYLLSLIVVMICSLPALLSQNRSKKVIRICLVVPLGTLLFMYLFGSIRLYNQNTEQSDTTIRIVQPSIPQAMKWKKETLEYNFNQYIRISQSRKLDNIDFVIWGETATPFPLDYDFSHLQDIREAVPDNGYLVTGLVRYKFDIYQNYYPLNSMFIIDEYGQILASYDKSHLVPFGEYIPLRQYLPEFIRPVANAIGNFLSGNGPTRIQVPGQPSLGALICYEVIFPHQILDQSQRPQWLINLTNDGWYGDSSGPYQHLVSTRMRAVEEGMTIARAANTGISALISPYGAILGELPLNYTGILDVSLPKVSQFQTIYSRLGNLPVLLLCTLLLVVSSILALLRHRKG